MIKLVFDQGGIQFDWCIICFDECWVCFNFYFFEYSLYVIGQGFVVIIFVFCYVFGIKGLLFFNVQLYIDIVYILLKVVVKVGNFFFI